jgi:lipoprotein-anchoring transpeptidase ErfK/SrfK
MIARALLVAGAAACAAGALAAPAGAVVGAVVGATVLATTRLSDEHVESRWAHPTRAATIRRAPSNHAARVGRLHHRTEDGLPEVYLLLSKKTYDNGHQWVRLRVPGRPNGRIGWVPRSALGAFHVVATSIVVDRRTLRLTLFRHGKVVKRFPVGVGKPSTPTPAGRFVIRELLKVPGKHTIYGPYAFGTSDYSVLSDWPGGGVIGIHGTDEPGLIPGRPSHGCMRLRNRDVAYLAGPHGAPVGTPIRIV